MTQRPSYSTAGGRRLVASYVLGFFLQLVGEEPKADAASHIVFLNFIFGPNVSQAVKTIVQAWSSKTFMWFKHDFVRNLLCWYQLTTFNRYAVPLDALQRWPCTSLGPSCGCLCKPAMRSDKSTFKPFWSAFVEHSCASGIIRP